MRFEPDAPTVLTDMNVHAKINFFQRQNTSV
jgi:hypothetical protein